MLATAACQAETDNADLPVDESPPAMDTTPASRPAPPAAEPRTPAGTPAAEEPQANQIPAAYRGKWDSDAAACARTTSEMRLNINAGRLRFYEGSSRVLAVRDVGNGIEVDGQHSAEGTTDRRTYRLAVSGDRLTVTINGNAATRVRCPSR
jgi:hypothetical protein